MGGLGIEGGFWGGGGVGENTLKQILNQQNVFGFP